MIKLDWDNITWTEVEKRINYIKSFRFIKRIEICESPSLSGYHVRIQTKYPINETLSYRYRQMFKDDGNRLVKDILFRTKNIPHDILFNSKTIKGKAFYETPMITSQGECS